jgi:hypothetical protein
MIQINGDSVLFRLAWTWLNRYHEPTLVGAAVTLFGLAFGLPTLPEPTRAAGLERATALASFAPPPSGQIRGTGGQNTARDDAYYRQKWASDAAAFYAANPPRDFDAVVETGPIIAASMRTGVGKASDSTDIAQASHSDDRISWDDPASATDKASAGSLATPNKIALMPPLSRNGRVATFVAAGLLASLVFAGVWPVREWKDGASAKFGLHKSGRESSPPSDAIAITLPSVWVRVRPTGRETVRRGILGTSYAMAGAATWGIWF